jgi:hypothetical protein
MLKYFDNTFFKFLFGFLLILIISFAVLLATRLIDEKESPPEFNTYVEAQQAQGQN